MLPPLLLIIVVVGLSPAVLSQSPGRVFVGTSENDTTQLYSFNENFLPNGLVIPVYITLFNETTGEPIDYTSDVLVTCELIPSEELGFSEAVFQIERVTAGPPSPDPIFLTVGFDTVVPGRPVVVQCWGQSDVIGAELPQFTKVNSMSDNYAFEIRPPGTINVFNPLIIIPNKPLSMYNTGDFLLELSDNPLSNVSVECHLNVTGIDKPLNVAFWPLPRIIPVDQQRFMMAYNVTAKGNAVPFYCTANSVSAGDYVQFITATSTGDTSVITIAEGLVSMFPVATTLKTTTMNAFLVLNDVPVIETILYCTIQTVNSTDEANDIAADETCIGPDLPPPVTNPPFVTVDENDTQTTRLPTAAPTTPVPSGTRDPGTGTPIPPTTAPVTNQTGEWKLEETEFIFQADASIFQTLTMYRTTSVSDFTEEIIVTRCCAPENRNSKSPQFVNASATMMTVAYNTPSFPINWTAATTLENINVQTTIQNPGFVNIAPCPCDLRQGACDTDCCCDSLCTADQLTTFTCIPGVEGGYPAPPARYNCDVRYPLQEDWFPILCVQFDNTGFLGYFYMNKTLLRTQSDINDILLEYSSPFSFEFDPSQVPQGFETDYTEGASVKTGLPRDTTSVSYDVGTNYRLTLPTRTWTGNCVWTSPVQFLVNDNQDCVRFMKENICTNESPLNALNYAQSSLWSGQTGAEVLRQQGSQIITETNVNYHCADDVPEYTSKYLKSTDSLDDVMPPDEVFLFDYTLPVDADGETECNFSPSTGAFVCVNQTEAVQPVPVPFPPRCSFDDGFTRPPAPVYDDSTNICYNAVVEVDYDFVWSGQEILYLNATVVLADIPLETVKTANITVRYTDSEEINNQTVRVPRVNITEEVQTFTTEFTQVFTTNFASYPSVVEQNETSVENLTESRTGQYMRSGNPGYDYNLPVISGVEVINDTTGAFIYFNANDSHRLSLWEPNTAGLCTNAGRQIATFGQNSMTSCILRLSAAELDDCDNLRKLILNRQDNMMPSGFISIGGDPNRYNPNDWTQVFREDISYLFNVTEEVTPTTDINVTETTGTNSPVTDTTTTAATTTEETTTFDPFSVLLEPELIYPYLDSLNGRCMNVTSGITATIMYAEVGLVNSIPIYQIVGAKIEYTLSNWTMYCAGSLGGACYGNESYVEQDGTIKIQPFMLSTAVNYIKVPAQAPTPMTEYEERNYVPAYICQYDSCWRELFYPWTKYNLGDQETYALVMGLLFLIYGIGLVLILRPISRWG